MKCHAFPHCCFGCVALLRIASQESTGGLKKHATFGAMVSRFLPFIFILFSFFICVFIFLSFFYHFIFILFSFYFHFIFIFHLQRKRK